MYWFDALIYYVVAVLYDLFNSMRFPHEMCKIPFKNPSYHLQRPLSKVPLSDQSLLVSDVESSLSQSLDDGIVAQRGLGGVALQDEVAGSAVEVCGEQEAGHGRLQVLLLILVCVERVLQVCWDAVCIMEGKKGLWGKKFHSFPGRHNRKNMQLLV